MRLVGRSFVVGAVLFLAACASIAGLEDPASTSGTDAGSFDSGGSPGDAISTEPSDDAASSGGETPEPDAGPSSDAEVDAPPPLCQPPKRPDGEPCAAPAECCSNACSEAAKCRRGCKTSIVDLCNILDDECCIGLYCAIAAPPIPLARCKKCLPAGSSPEGGNLKSCCSRAVDANGKCSE